MQLSELDCCHGPILVPQLDMGDGAYQNIDMCAFAVHFPLHLGLWKLFHEEICSFWDCTHAGAVIVQHYWVQAFSGLQLSAKVSVQLEDQCSEELTLL